MIVACLPGCHLVSMVGSVLLIALRKEARDPGHPRDRAAARPSDWLLHGLVQPVDAQQSGFQCGGHGRDPNPGRHSGRVGPEGMYAGVADPLGKIFRWTRMQAKGNMGRTLMPAATRGGRIVLATPPSRWNPTNRTILFAAEGRRTGPGAFFPMNPEQKSDRPDPSLFALAIPMAFAFFWFPPIPLFIAVRGLRDTKDGKRWGVPARIAQLFTLCV